VDLPELSPGESREEGRLLQESNKAQLPYFSEQLAAAPVVEKAKWENSCVLSKKHKVLLAEDNHQMRGYLVDCLQEHYEVVEVANGQDGSEQALDYQPDVIITDIMMPTMDGIELCRKLKNDLRTSHIPVIFLTARTALDQRIKGLMTGADAYLTKPFSFDHLHALAQSLLFNRKQLWKAFNSGNYKTRTESMLGPLDQRFMDQVLKIADRQLKNADFNVEQFAREMAMSRSYFHRKLKALTGFAASEFLREHRLQQAVNLIVENQLTISEIAYEVGFSSPNYFGRCFRKKFGMSPSDYKERLFVNSPSI
jgi:DNA-binding response OmpR family regulator